MLTIESLTKRLDDLEKDRGYFSIEDIILTLECPVPGETLFQTLHREHPGKTIHPGLVSLLLEKPPVDHSQ